jgi:hypothetical protein
MNTKLVMTFSAVVLGASGLALTFAPDVILSLLSVAPDKAALILLQIIGALYFAFAMLNWMTKESRIGGIYNRPIAVANLTHYIIAGLAIVKAVIADNDLSTIFWAAGIIYVVLGICFGVIMYTHPAKQSDD